jgi:hypothetical protein
MHFLAQHVSRFSGQAHIHFFILRSDSFIFFALVRLFTVLPPLRVRAQ